MNLVHHFHPYQTQNMPPRRIRRNSERPYTLIVEAVPDRAQLIALSQRMTEGQASQAVAMRFGWAICHWKDEFSRKKGTETARGKLLTELVYVDTVTVRKDGVITFGFNLYEHDHVIALSKSGRPTIDGELGPDRLLFALASADEPKDAGEVQS